MNKHPHHRSFFFFINFIIAGAIFLWSCGKQAAHPYQQEIPPGFPAPVIPVKNPMTREKAELGKLLFFDPILSDDSTISCATCHIPERGYTDGQKVSLGIHGNPGHRNAPTLVNVAYYPYFFAEGKVKDLETQALAPGLHSAEMGTGMEKMIYRLRKNKFYNSKFMDVFGNEPDVKYFVYALASYERTLIAANSKYDRYKRSNDSSEYTLEEWKGLELFFSKRAACSECHSGNLFTDFGFYNIGLYEVYPDEGLARATVLSTDSGRFKTPTLRNIEYTAPYMHDGSIATLEEVVDFYNAGGKKHPNKDKRIRPLELNDDEKAALVSFLKTLTDEDLKDKKGIFRTPILEIKN